MHAPRFEWTTFASQLDGAGFARFQRELTKFNRRRLEPSLPEPGWRGDVGEQCRVLEAEGVFVEAVRAEIAPLVADIPQDVDGFLAWFERLRETGPGQGDALFPWLAAKATLPQMIWFIEQEVAGEAGFDDLLAFTQVKMPEQAKLEMARNYWDEMGRGASKGMHGPMLERLAHYLDVHPTPDSVIPEALALGNMMVALAHALHAVLDVKHSAAWNREVLRSLVADDPRRAQAIGEGAVLRLWHGARCFERYRETFNLSALESEAA